MLYKKIKKIDSDTITREANKIIEIAGWGEYHQIALQNSNEVGFFNDIDNYGNGGRDENLVTNWHPILEGTYLKEILSSLDFPVANLRLMRLVPLQCHPTHYDHFTRYHISIDVDSDNSFMVFPEHNQILKVKKGFIYWTNTYETHNYINGSFKERINLIFNNANETKDMFEDYIKNQGKTLE